MNVDVAGAAGDAFRQDAVHEPDHRRVLLGGGGELVGAELEQFIDDLLDGLATGVEAFDGEEDVALGSGDEIDLESRGLFEGVKRRDVQRIGNRDGEEISLARNGHGDEAARELFGDEFDHLRRDDDCGEIDGLGLRLLREELRERLLGDEAELGQSFAEEPAFALLFAQGEVELRLGDEAAVEQPVTEADGFLSLRHNSQRDRRKTDWL